MSIPSVSPPQQGCGVPGRAVECPGGPWVPQSRLVSPGGLGSLGGLQGPQEGSGVPRSPGAPKHNWRLQESWRLTAKEARDPQEGYGVPRRKGSPGRMGPQRNGIPRRVVGSPGDMDSLVLFSLLLFFSQKLLSLKPLVSDVPPLVQPPLSSFLEGSGCSSLPVASRDRFLFRSRRLILSIRISNSLGCWVKNWPNDWTRSGWRSVTGGIPQGSIVDPGGGWRKVS